MDGIIKLSNKKDDGPWKYNTTLCGHGLDGRNGYLLSVSFSQGGLMIASGSIDGIIKLWNKNVDDTWTYMATLNGHNGPAYSLNFSPDGKILASGFYDGIIKLWNKNDDGTWTCFATLQGHKGPVCSVSFSPDGRTLASGSDDGTIRFWDIASMTEIQHFFAHQITLEQSMLLNLVMQLHSFGQFFDLTQEDQAHQLEIFKSLSDEIRKLLIEKRFVKVQ
jgi:WD40 repeat protein